ncbi:unannotated protein [freshwater metagenome]|uniref:Unannotated protein n=1 Tax=freshwater metagenome TaxID=449393 RepID=A0A6J7QRN9_9ZZZZ
MATAGALEGVGAARDRPGGGAGALGAWPQPVIGGPSQSHPEGRPWPSGEHAPPRHPLRRVRAQHPDTGGQRAQGTPERGLAGADAPRPRRNVAGRADSVLDDGVPAAASPDGPRRAHRRCRARARLRLSMVGPDRCRDPRCLRAAAGAPPEAPSCRGARPGCGSGSVRPLVERHRSRADRRLLGRGRGCDPDGRPKLPMVAGAALGPRVGVAALGRIPRAVSPVADLGGTGRGPGGRWRVLGPPHSARAADTCRRGHRGDVGRRAGLLAGRQQGRDFDHRRHRLPGWSPRGGRRGACGRAAQRSDELRDRGAGGVVVDHGRRQTSEPFGAVVGVDQRTGGSGARWTVGGVSRARASQCDG